MSLRPTLELAYDDDRDYAALRAALGSGERTAHASGSIQPYLIAALAEDESALGDRPVVVVAPDDVGARDLARELGAYLAPRRVRHYPSRGTGYASHVAPPPHLVGLRIAALDALTAADAGEPAVVVASAVALAETVPDASLRPEGFSLRVGEEIDLTFCAELLAEAGYERVDQVEARGQFALRGGILDVFGATEDRAARLELFGDEIESIRWFSTFTQRSLGDAEELELSPAAELASEHRMLAEAALEDTEEGGPIEYLPVDSFRAPLDLIGADVALVTASDEEIEPALRSHWEDVTAAMHSDDARRLYVDVAAPLEERAVLRLRSTAPDEGMLSIRAQAPASAARSISEAEPQLEREVRSGYRVVVAFEHRGEAERARYNLQRLDTSFLGAVLPAEPGVHLTEAHIGEGFVSPALKLAVIPWRKLVHRRSAAAPTVRGTLASMADLAVGDHVVHQDHGIARFAGFETKTVAGVIRDYLELEYRGEDRVFAPTEQLAKITRYVGVGGEAPQLSALGSKRWDSIKARARRAARVLAGDLLNLYAERAARRGHAFGPDSEWSLQLELAFPYRETADQLEAIEATRADMESERPMDRLICGDVGYGKTEVALRAAAKAAGEGKQVMILVPTTVLAQQHLGTFRERFSDLPFEVDAVSRLRKPAEVRATLKAFSEGTVDILIGTHRLLSRDVRAKDLGLLIVDEEQRFGVKQKELLRQLKLRVDVLSLSATPIPRTLQMSLAGLRDISVIETPPEGRRPIRTYVGPYDEELVAKAIRRETERGGQCFFLHNRIETLHDMAERLRALCPGVRFAEAHGQMDMGELESTMLGFLRGDADCLVATTIIESGLDIPQANTLIVERADLLGLAQAYQIRGTRRAARRSAPSPTCSTRRRRRSRPRRRRGLRRFPTTPSSARASRSPCATSSFAARETSWATSSRATSRRSASSSTSRCSRRRRRRSGREARRELPSRRSGSTWTSRPTCRATTSPTRPQRSSSTAGLPARGRWASCARSETTCATASGPCPSPSRPCSSSNARASRSARPEAAWPRCAEGASRSRRSSSIRRGLAAIREEIPEAMYETARQTLSLRVADEPAERLAALLGLVGALTAPEPALVESR